MSNGPSRTSDALDLFGGGFRDILTTALPDAARRIAADARQLRGLPPIDNLYAISDSYTFAELGDMDPITLAETGVWIVWADLAVSVESTTDQMVYAELMLSPGMTVRGQRVPCWVPSGVSTSFVLNAFGIYVVDGTLDVHPIASLPADAATGNAQIGCQLLRPLSN